MEDEGNKYVIWKHDESDCAGIVRMETWDKGNMWMYADYMGSFDSLFKAVKEGKKVAKDRDYNFDFKIEHL